MEPFKSAGAWWRAPGASAEHAGVERSVLLLLALQRAVCAMALLSSEAPRPPAAVLAVMAGWNGCLFGLAGYRGRMCAWMAEVDVGLAVGWLALAARAGHDDWAYRATLSAAALSGAALSLRQAASAVSVLVAVYVAATLIRKDGQVSPTLAADIGLIAIFAVVVGYGAHSMRKLSRRVGKAPPAQTVPPALARGLHDSALATLTAIAGGRLDHRTEQVRRRAAQDVAHIRRLLVGEQDDNGSPLGTRLREVVSSAELLGLTIHRHGGPVSGDLPPDAVAALADATREALNNVATHAGTGECWLTLITDGRRVTVRVVDRGRGFDPESRSPGFGLRRSVLERIAACGGTARLSSAPGTGTCVDLTWPK